MIAHRSKWAVLDAAGLLAEAMASGGDVRPWAARLLLALSPWLGGRADLPLNVDRVTGGPLNVIARDQRDREREVLDRERELRESRAIRLTAGLDLPGGGECGVGGDLGVSGAAVFDFHDDSPSVGPGVGPSGVDPTVGEDDGAVRDDSPPAAPSPIARMGANSQRLYALLDLLSDAAYRVQASLTEDRPAEVLRIGPARLLADHLSIIAGQISEMAKRWQS